MGKNPQSNSAFRIMAFKFMLRDLRQPPAGILVEAGARPGIHVLDFGCGPGSFSLAAARIVGETGFVTAVDIHPLALTSVERFVHRRRLKNVRVLAGGNIAKIGDGSVDLVLLYDILHIFSDSNAVLKTLHRTLKCDGILPVSDHHMLTDDIISKITCSGLYRLKKHSQLTLEFEPVVSEKAAP